MPDAGPLIDPHARVLEFEASRIQHVVERYRNPWDRARRPMVQQAQLAHAFLNGAQYVRHVGHQLKPIPLPPHMKNQVRMVNNLFRPAARVMLSMLTRNRPSFGIRALTDDFVDQARTIVGEKLLASLELATKKREVDLRNWLWLLKGGTTIKRTIFNPDAGAIDDDIATDDEGRQLFRDLDDKVVRNQDEVAEILVGLIESNPDVPEDTLFEDRFVPIVIPVPIGEIETKVYSVMEFMTDPSFWNLIEADKLIYERVLTVDTIKAIWPEKGPLVEGSEQPFTQFDTTIGAALLPGMGLPRVTGRTGTQQGGPEKAVIHEMLCKPGAENPWTGEPMPFGSHVVWSGNIALTDLDEPLPYAETPETDKPDLDFDGVDYRWLIDDGFYGPSFFTDLLSPQQSLNRRMSQIAESINAFAHPKALVPHGARVKRGSFADVAGEIIEFSGLPPSYLEPPTIRPYVFKFMEMLVQQFNDISLLHEVIRQGRVPPQVRTADGLRQLQETDTLALAATLSLYEESEARTGQKMLDRARQFYQDERILQYIGDKNKLEVEVFKASEFFQNDWGVFVHTGSTMPTSKAAQIASAFQMLQFAPQLLMDEQTGTLNKALFARIAGMGEFDFFLEEQDESRQAAQHENMQMDQGIEIAPRPYEEDAVHLRQHYAIIRSPDFREKPEEIQRLFLEHASAHEQNLNRKVQNMNQIGAQISQQAQAAEAAARQAGVEAGVASARAEAERLVGPNIQEMTESPGSGSSNALVQQLMQNPAFARGQ